MEDSLIHCFKKRCNKVLYSIFVRSRSQHRCVSSSRELHTSLIDSLLQSSSLLLLPITYAVFRKAVHLTTSFANTKNITILGVTNAVSVGYARANNPARLWIELRGECRISTGRNGQKKENTKTFRRREQRKHHPSRY